MAKAQAARGWLAVWYRGWQAARRRPARRPRWQPMLEMLEGRLTPSTTYYVDQVNGTPTGTGTASSPFSTISAASKLVRAGDTVLVFSGTYNEMVTVKGSGTAAAPITLTAAPGATVNVTGGTNGFKLSGVNYVKVIGFHVTGTSSYGVYVLNSNNCSLLNNEVSNSGTPAPNLTAVGIKLSNSNGCLIDGNSSHNNSDAGIQLSSGSTGDTVSHNQVYSNARGDRAAPGIDVRSPGNTVAFNVSHDNEDSGIQFYSTLDLANNASNCLAVGNVVYNNGDHGIDNLRSTGQRIIGNTVYNNVTAGINLEGLAPNGSTNGTVEDNVCVNNGLNTSPRTNGNIRIDPDSEVGVLADYNIVFSPPGNAVYTWGKTTYTTLAGFQAASGQGAHDLQADPLFVNAAGGNFHILASSPAIDSADSGASGETATDFDGYARLDDPATPNTGVGPFAYYDRGAFEFQPPTRITGQVYEDHNGNAAPDAGDQGVGGWTVFLDANSNGSLDTGEASTTSAADGTYSFTVAPGTYRVRLQGQPGWLQTTANPADVTVASNATASGQNFGAFHTVTVSGTAFNDLNANGAWNQPGEPALAGRTVFLDANNNGSPDPGEASTTTDGTGAYAFTNLGPGTYHVCQVLPAGWSATTPNPTDVTTASGVNATANHGSFQPVSITGLVYEDRNGNAALDTGDPGLAGWTVFLDANSNGKADQGEASTTTDANGNYAFGGLVAGTYRVRLAPPAGWVQTTANPADVSPAPGASVSGGNFGAFHTVTVSGVVYEDHNGNAAQDTGDQGLASWTVFLDANGNGSPDQGEASTTTDGTGAYAFTNVGPGSYAVRLQAPGGWVQTTTNPAGFTAGSGQNVPLQTFGAFQQFTISGLLFEDDDGNGTQGQTEPALAGRTVFLDANGNGSPDQGEASTTTGSDGTYAFPGLGPGTYKVREVLPAGWVQTTPNPQDIGGQSGVNAPNVNFGSRLGTGTITGLVYEDHNGNAAADTGDQGLAGRTVFLDANGNGSLDTGETTTTTDVNGNYSFANLPSGTYHVREVLPAGWVETTPTPADTSVTGGTVAGPNFGTFQQVILSGVVFQDNDGNGSRGSADAPLQGWTVFLDANGNGSLDTGEVSATSAVDGTFAFAALGPGTYRVREVLPAGWRQTSANPADVPAASGLNVGGQNFGDVAAAVKFVYVDQNNPNATDAGTGTAAQPFKTISAASLKATAGTNVVVASGTYTEMVTVAANGTQTNPVLFTAADGATVTVTGGTSGFKVSSRSWVTIRGFRVTGTTSYGINITGSSNITIDGNDVSYAGLPGSSTTTAKGIYLSQTTASVVSHNVAHNNSDSGIYLAAGTSGVTVVGNTAYGNARGYARAACGIEARSGGNTIVNNITHDNEDSGISVNSINGTSSAGASLIANNVSYLNGDNGIHVRNAAGQSVIGNTVYGNTAAGINVDTSSTGATIENNISTDNATGASPLTRGNIRVDATSQSGTNLDYDLLYSTAAGQVMVTWGSTTYTSVSAFAFATLKEMHGLQADPRYVNAAAGNFRLLAGSAAIDSADSAVAGEQTTDADGRARVDDLATPNTGNGPFAYYDRGAYEYQSGS